MKTLLVIIIALLIVGCSHTREIQSSGTTTIEQKEAPKEVKLVAKKGAIMTTFHKTSVDADTLSRLFFMGKNGIKVLMLYEEFVNNYSIPTFGKNIQYSLANGNVFSYKTIEIEILSVSDNEIKFIVTQY